MMVITTAPLERSAYSPRDMQCYLSRRQCHGPRINEFHRCKAYPWMGLLIGGPCCPSHRILYANGMRDRMDNLKHPWIAAKLAPVVEL